jgi:hypothetical protein
MSTFGRICVITGAALIGCVGSFLAMVPEIFR